MSQEEKKNAAQEPETAEVKTEANTEAVSYTHLTLPTNMTV